MYDQANGAFLVQSVTLEALAGSGGLSTDIVLYVGDMAFSLDNTVDASYLTFGLGEDQLANNPVGETDGAAHATITVAAQGPSALVMRAGWHVATIATRDRDEEVTALGNVAIRALRREVLSESRNGELRVVDAAIADRGSLHASRRVARGVRAVLRGHASAGLLQGVTLA